MYTPRHAMPPHGGGIATNADTLHGSYIRAGQKLGFSLAEIGGQFPALWGPLSRVRPSPPCSGIRSQPSARVSKLAALRLALASGKAPESSSEHFLRLPLRFKEP